MIHRTPRLLDGAALLFALALPTAALAQAARPGADAQGQPEAARPADADHVTRAERAVQRDRVLSAMREEELRHRERLASIYRLRELAEKQGQADRMAAIDKLEVKENSRFGALLQYKASQLGGNDAYKHSLLKLSAGRIRRVVREPVVVDPVKAQRGTGDAADPANATGAGTRGDGATGGAAAPEGERKPAADAPRTGDKSKGSFKKSMRVKRTEGAASRSTGRTSGRAKSKATPAPAPAPAPRTDRPSDSSSGSSGAPRAPRSDA